MNSPLLAILVLSLLYTSQGDCLDEKGNAVDWFIALKTARDSDSDFSPLATGVAYTYIDANSPKPFSFKLSSLPLSGAFNNMCCWCSRHVILTIIYV